MMLGRFHKMFTAKYASPVAAYVYQNSRNYQLLPNTTTWPLTLNRFDLPSKTSHHLCRHPRQTSPLDPPFPNSRQERWDIFEKWMVLHDKVYDSEQEKIHTFEIISQAMDYLNEDFEDNIKEFGHGCEIGLSFSSDWLPSLYPGLILTDDEDWLD